MRMYAYKSITLVAALYKRQTATVNELVTDTNMHRISIYTSLRCMEQLGLAHIIGRKPIQRETQGGARIEYIWAWRPTPKLV